VDVAGRRTGFADHPVGQRVQFEQAHSYVGGVLERSQDTRDEFAGRAHLLDLGGSFEFDHASTLMRPSADARSHPSTIDPGSARTPGRARTPDPAADPHPGSSSPISPAKKLLLPHLLHSSVHSQACENMRPTHPCARSLWKTSGARYAAPDTLCACPPPPFWLPRARSWTIFGAPPVSWRHAAARRSLWPAGGSSP